MKTTETYTSLEYSVETQMKNMANKFESIMLSSENRRAFLRSTGIYTTDWKLSEGYR